MMTGPTQPEMGRLRVSDQIRRSETNRMAGAIASARAEHRRARIRGAFGSWIAALRSRRESASQPVAAAPIESRG
jgi:hypothetical protein